MKSNLTTWLQPYSFKDQQRKELMQVLPRRTAKDKEATSRFIEAARKEVEIWLSVNIVLFTTAPSEHREKLEHLKKAATELLAALDAIPSDTGARLRAIVYTRLYCDPYKNKHIDLANNLKNLGMPDPLRGDFLNEVLGLLVESSTHMVDNLDVRPGVNNDQMISLTAKISDHYMQCFQKEPTAGNGSNFRKFMSELSVILGYDFGAQTVKDALKIREEVRKLNAVKSLNN